MLHAPRSGRPLVLALLVAALLPLAPAAAAAGTGPSASVAPSVARVPSTGAAGSSASALPSSSAALGHDRLGVRRGDTWILRDSLDGGPGRAYREGGSDWLPVAGDFDGDGSASPGLYRDGVWQLRDREGGRARTLRYGVRGDVPVVGDWDGDGVDTLGVFRDGRWSLRSGNGPADVTRSVFRFGLPGDVPVVGDWDATGTDDIAVRRGTTWLQRDAVSSGPVTRRFTFGRATDVPVAGDWDHDGRDTPGLFRDGTWYLRRASSASPHVSTVLGRRGDRPVVRRTSGLAPGVHHRVVRNAAAPWVAHVATVELAAASSPETVLSNEHLRGTELLTSMVRRTGAVLGVNGDFFLGSGRPVHLHANDGQLLQSSSSTGRAVGLDRTGTVATLGAPEVRMTLTGGAPARTVDLLRLNSGGPSADRVSAWTASGAGPDGPPDGQCYAGLRPAGTRVVQPDGAVHTPLVATGPRCGGARPRVPTSATVLAAGLQGAGATFLRSLTRGAPATLSAQLGFPGAVDVLGGGPMLVAGGAVTSAEVDGTDGFFGRHPRTAVGVTADGRLLLVVVDGRQRGYSRGMTMRELAELMLRLGARDAVNLDGGGSSTMVVNGAIANRPSGVTERPVSNALVVLPGADRGEADLAAAPAPAPARAAASLRSVVATDPASTGGLADALVRSGAPVPAELRRAAALLRASEAG